MSAPKHHYLLEAVPGLIFSSINRFQELKQCLGSSCDSWAVKYEQILVHSSFLFGYISPRRFIWDTLSNLLGRTVPLAGITELEFRMGMSLLEQLGLTYVWDYVRDSSLCMRFNNCDNDFLAQISNIKISTCKVQSKDLKDDKRDVSVCEQIFNDSPLILLAAAMILLTIITYRNENKRQNEAVVANSPSPGDDKSNSTGSAPSSPPLSVNGQQDKSTVFAANFNAFVSPSFNNNNSNISNNKNSESGKPDSLPTSNSNLPSQNIDAECPNCKKKFTCAVPNPWTLCCAQISSVIEKKDPSNVSKKTDAAVDKVINELFKDIKCSYCKDILKKKLKEIKSKKEKASESSQKGKKPSK